MLIKTLFFHLNLVLNYWKFLKLLLVIWLLIVVGHANAQVLSKDQAQNIYNTQIGIHKAFYSNLNLAKNRLDSLIKQYTTYWPDSLLIGNYKLKGIYYQRTFALDSSEFYLKKVIALDKKSLNVNPFNLFNLGVTLKKKQDYKEALEVLTDANIIAFNNKNNYALSIIKEEISSVYTRLQNYQLALDYRLDAIKVLKSVTPIDSISLTFSKHNLADLHFKLGNLKEAEQLFKEVSSAFKKLNKIPTHHLANTNLANTYIELGKLNKADSLIISSIKGFEKFNNKNYLSYAKETKANILLKQDKVLQAEALYTKLVNKAYKSYNERLYNLLIHYFNSLELSKNKSKLNQEMLRFVAYDQGKSNLQYGVYDKTKIYKFLLDHLSQTKQKEAFNYAKKQLYQMQDSLVTIAEYNIKKQLESEFQKQSIEKDKLLLDQRNKILDQDLSKKNQLLIFISLLAAILLLTGILFIYHFKRLNKLKINENKLLQAKEDSLTKKLQAEKDLNDFKNTEIKDYKNKLVTLAIEAQEFKDKLKTYTAKNLPEYKDLRQLTHDDFNFKYWDLLIDKFKRYNPKFIAQLKDLNPKTSKRQIDFCIMVRLGIENRVIAAALNVSYETVITTKSRLKKHFNINKSNNFDDFIENIKD